MVMETVATVGTLHKHCSARAGMLFVLQGCVSHALIAAKSLSCRFTSYLGMDAFPFRS